MTQRRFPSVDEVLGRSSAMRKRNPGIADNCVSDPVAHVERSAAHEPERADGREAAYSRVRIKVRSFRARQCDPDGICIKWAVDALVRAGVIADDRAEFVESVTSEMLKVPKAEERTEITVTPATKGQDS